MPDTIAMSLPVSFSQSLSIAGQQHRCARIGNPYAYLTSIGIGAVLEHLYRGANLVDAAAALDVSVTLLRNWLEQEGHWVEVEAATSISAEGYLSLGQHKLKVAKDKFELDQAKALIEHARWMAMRLNKPMYGTQEVMQAPTTVSYTFNVGGDAQIATLAPRPHALAEEDAIPAQVLPVEFELVPMGTLYPADVAAPDVGPFGPPAKHKALPDKDTLSDMWSQTED